jgi:hypothetical protein
MKGGQRFLITLVLQEDRHISPGPILEGDCKEQIRIEFLKLFIDEGIFDVFQGTQIKQRHNVVRQVMPEKFFRRIPARKHLFEKLVMRICDCIHEGIMEWLTSHVKYF